MSASDATTPDPHDVRYWYACAGLKRETADPLPMPTGYYAPPREIIAEHPCRTCAARNVTTQVRSMHQMGVLVGEAIAHGAGVDVVERLARCTEARAVRLLAQHGADAPLCACRLLEGEQRAYARVIAATRKT